MKKINKISIAAASLIGVLLVVGLLSQEKHWDGTAQWTFKVHIYEQGSMRPVSHAAVKVIVKNETEFGSIESFVKPSDTANCKTNSNGICAVTSEFNYWGRKTLLKSEEYINFRNRSISVVAAGYQPIEASIDKLISSTIRLNDKRIRNGTSDIILKLKRS